MSPENDFSDQSVTPYLFPPLLQPAVSDTFLSLPSQSCIYMHSLKLAFLVTFKNKQSHHYKQNHTGNSEIQTGIHKFTNCRNVGA